VHVKARTVPEAYWGALKAVHEQGCLLRTQYDRKENGRFIDPPGRDAKALIEISDPFAQPRFPILSYCERGKYIAEILGAKDHLVVPYPELLRMAAGGGEFEATQWPYCYHQRLAAHPGGDGRVVDQLDAVLDKLAKDPITRRGIATTRVPEIDLFMKEDQPCLGEIQLRAIEDGDGALVLNLHAHWRSRDLYKAWGDNVIGITSLQARLARRLQEKAGRPVRVGPYTESNGSLHIYGQDYAEKGADRFFERFPTAEEFVRRSWTSDFVREMIVADLRALKAEEVWRFPPGAVKLMDGLIEDYESGRCLP
jgi:hypothetical protein